jgi:hypothetical protein
MSESPEPAVKSSNPRLQALLGHEFFAPHQWKRRFVLWFGAVLVALAAILFAKASSWAYQLFQGILSHGSWIPLILTPVVFGLLAWITEGRLRATRGSGIPQVIGTLHIEDEGFRARMLALPIAAGKMALTLIALAVGASIGLEGPDRACRRRPVLFARPALRRYRTQGRLVSSLPVAPAASLLPSMRRWPAWCSRSRSSPAPWSIASAACCRPP